MGFSFRSNGHPPEYVDMEIEYMREFTLSATQQAFAISSEPAVPKIFQQAMASPRKAEWEEACR
jgi:hypothetical protein